jgi:glutaredoxin
VKELLSREQVAFTVKDVETDDRAYDELIALGFRVVPLTVIGDRMIKGYDAAALTDALAALGGAENTGGQS